MKFKEFVEEKGLSEEETKEFTEFVRDDFLFAQGQDIDNEEIDEEDLEDSLDDFRNQDEDDEDEEGE